MSDERYKLRAKINCCGAGSVAGFKARANINPCFLYDCDNEPVRSFDNKTYGRDIQSPLPCSQTPCCYCQENVRARGKEKAKGGSLALCARHQSVVRTKV